MGNDAQHLDSLAGKIRRLSRGFSDDVTLTRERRLLELINLGGHLLQVEKNDDGTAWYRVGIDDGSHKMIWLEFNTGPNVPRRGVVRFGVGGFRTVPVSSALAEYLSETIECAATTKKEFMGGYRLTA